MEMELFSAAFFSALFAIVLIDLVLAGDNALVIGLVARDLPKHQQKKVIYWGTAGAIIIRAVMAIAVVWLLKIPGLMLVGGIALVWIARKLLEAPPDTDAHSAHAKPAGTLMSAIKTIVVADAVMGIDNVLAIGGAAHGSVLLIVLGLLISVPIIVWGSQLVIKLVDRFPVVILLGGAVLAWTAYTMIVREPLLKDWLAAHTFAKPAIAIIVFSISMAPWFAARLAEKHKPLVALLPVMLLWFLGFEAASDALKIDVNYAQAGDLRDYALQALRWFGWVPLALLWLAYRERRRPAKPATARS